MSVAPDDVNMLTKPTAGILLFVVALYILYNQFYLYISFLFIGFLCPVSANTFGIDFLNFTISDYESKKTIFEVGRDNPNSQDVSVDFSSMGEDMYRKIKYEFSEDVLRLPYIQTR